MPSVSIRRQSRNVKRRLKLRLRRALSLNAKPAKATSEILVFRSGPKSRGAFRAEPPCTRGQFVRILPPLPVTRNTENAGQIHALGLGRKRLMSKSGIRLAAVLDRHRRENERRLRASIASMKSYRGLSGRSLD